MAKRFYWNELTSPEFSALDPASTVAILPLASTEQHGPHLPVATDVAIAQGMLDTLKENLPEELDVLLNGSREKWEVATIVEYLKFDHGYTRSSRAVDR